MEMLRIISGRVKTAAYLFINTARPNNCIYLNKTIMTKVTIETNGCDQPGGDQYNRQVIEYLMRILNNQSIIMAAIDELKTQSEALQQQVNGLQTSLDAEQAQVAALLETNAGVVTSLNNQITALQEQVANGATPEQIQEVANNLTNISASIATTKADLEGTIADGDSSNNGGPDIQG